MSGDAGDTMHFFVSVVRLPADGMPIRFEAKPEELAAVTRRLGIEAVDSLGADLLVQSWRGEGARVTGTLRAEVVQADVVTLEPLRQRVEEPVELTFVPENSRLARLPTPEDGELHLDPEGEDIPETFTGTRIDVGELLVEVLSLGLDPYPRASESRFEEPEPQARISPFDALKSLKDRGG